MDEQCTHWRPVPACPGAGVLGGGAMRYPPARARRSTAGTRHGCTRCSPGTCRACPAQPLEE